MQRSYDPIESRADAVTSEPTEGGVTIRMLARAIWEARKLGAAMVAVGLLLGVVYLAIREPQYSAEAVIGPPSSSDTGGGASRTLSMITGVNMSGSSAQFTKFLQVAASTRLAASLERNHGVMKHLISGWDESSHSWQPPSSPISAIKGAVKDVLGMPPWSPPTPATLAGALDKIEVISAVSGNNPLDFKSQIYRLKLTLDNKDYALKLLDWIIKESDGLVRQDEFERTSNRIAYLTNTINTTQEVNLRQSLQDVLTEQERILMTLKADRFYSVDIIDPPFVLPNPIGMRGTSVLVLAAIFGFAGYMAVLFAILMLRSQDMREQGSDPFGDPFPDPVVVVGQSIRQAYSWVKRSLWRPAPES